MVVAERAKRFGRRPWRPPLHLVLLLALCAPVRAADAAPPAVSIDVLMRLKGTSLEKSPAVQDALKRALAQTRGTPQFLELVRAFDVRDQATGLVELVVAFPGESVGAEAMQRLLDEGAAPEIRRELKGPNAAKIAQALRNVADDRAAELLESAPAAASAEPPATESSQRALENLPALLARKADRARGEQLYFGAAGCYACHQARGRGTDFGPDLSTIGDKFGKEAMYGAIVEPSAGIVFGYEPWQIRLRNGATVGIIASETDDEISVKTVGNIMTRYRRADVVSRRQLDISLMPAGILQAISDQDAADLLEYLSTLKAETQKAASP